MIKREERRTMQRAEGPGTEGRGALIVFEGLDRCGKSTQCELLLERLPKGTATLVKFPDRETATGKLIDAYLAEGQQIHDRAIHLLFSANRWEKRFFPSLFRTLVPFFTLMSLAGTCWWRHSPRGSRSFVTATPFLAWLFLSPR